MLLHPHYRDLAAEDINFKFGV